MSLMVTSGASPSNRVITYKRMFNILKLHLVHGGEMSAHETSTAHGRGGVSVEAQARTVSCAGGSDRGRTTAAAAAVNANGNALLPLGR